MRMNPLSSSSLPRVTKQMGARAAAAPPAAAPTAPGVPKTLAGPVAAPTPVQRKKWWEGMKLSLGWALAIMLVLAIVTAFVRAMSGGRGLAWLFEVPAAVQVAGDYATVLAPLLAVSVAIERLLETAFNWYEQSVQTVADVLAAPRTGLDWVRKELQDAYDAAEKVAGSIGAAVANSQALEVLNAAEARLAKAEQRLSGWTKAPEYVAFKRAFSIAIGLFVGLEVAVSGDLGMLHMIGFPVPRFVDMLVTGLVIGSGPGPMHSLIGILQGGKDSLQKLAELTEVRTVRESAKALDTRT
jgi:hypothetical protein